jgi:hypothetical protein
VSCPGHQASLHSIEQYVTIGGVAAETDAVAALMSMIAGDGGMKLGECPAEIAQIDQ